MVSDLVNQGYVTAQSLKDQPVDSVPVVLHQVSERVERGGVTVGFGGLHRTHNARYEAVWRELTGDATQQ